MLVKIWEIGKEMVWVILLMLLFSNQHAIVAQTILNGDFEDWKTNKANILEPVGWETQNDAQLLYVERAEGYSGNYAICLNVIWDNMMQKFTGASMSTVEDISVNSKFEFLEGYCKGSSNNTDSLKINISLYSMNKLIGNGLLSFFETIDEWMQFSVPIHYYSDEKPEKARISISVNPVQGSHHQTTYCIDDLSFH